jgi:hypothetical protein
MRGAARRSGVLSTKALLSAVHEGQTCAADRPSGLSYWFCVFA